MIRYDLNCSEGHGFDSWFQSAAAYDRLAAAGHVGCPVCGTENVQKALMAPSVAAADKHKTEGALSTPVSAAEQALAALRREVEANSEYVGLRFAAEARKIHDGQAPERAIYGEARLDEARKLIEDGVQVAPLPFLPARRSN